VVPDSLRFGNQNVGTTSAAQTVTLSNIGAGPLIVSSIAITSDFGETDNCGSSLPVGQQCTINVTFMPSVAGIRIGALTIFDNSNNVAGGTQTVTLSGVAQNFSVAANDHHTPASQHQDILALPGLIFHVAHQ
jgi:hypothetical protein